MAARVSDPPWGRQDWVGITSSWIEAQVGRLGYELIRPIEHFRQSSISCLLRVPTDAGDLFFKQSLDLPVFSNEPAVIEGLARLYPRHVPRAVAIEHRHGWLLLEDFGPPLGGEASPDAWEGVFSTLGRIQVDAAARIDTFASLGCRDRPLGQLARQIELLANPLASASMLDPLEAQQLRRLAPRLETMCCELREYRVPRSLVHGDLHLANVAFQGGTYLFFDWCDSCISHPFLDAAYIFAENVKHEAQCRDAYLAAWTEHEPMERLLTMWALAEPLSALHQAITYQETASYLREPSRTRFLGGAGFFVRQLLKAAVLRQA